MGSPYDKLNAGRGYIAPGSSGYDSSVPGYGLENVLSEMNISPQQYQEWAQLTSGLTQQQLGDLASNYGVNNGQYPGPGIANGSYSQYYPTNFAGTGGGTLYNGGQSPTYNTGVAGPVYGYDSTLGQMNSSVAADIAGIPTWQARDIFGAQGNMNMVASRQGQDAQLAAQQAAQQAAAQKQQDYVNARQAALSGSGGNPGYTPTQNPGVNPITGAGLGAASGVAQGASGVPGLVLPANQPGNNFFATDIGMAGPQGAAGSQAGVLNLYADLYGQGMNAVSQYGQAELGQLQNTYLQNSAAMQGQLRGAGLNNTTVGQSMQTGLAQSKDLALTNLNEQIGQYQTGVIGSLGTGVANAAASLYGQQQGINAQATANQQNINANFVNSQAALNAQAQQQQTQIAANAAQAQNQFNYATALASQQYGYNSNLQAQNLGLQNQYQRQLMQLQSQQANQASQGGRVAGGGANSSPGGSFV